MRHGNKLPKSVSAQFSVPEQGTTEMVQSLQSVSISIPVLILLITRFLVRHGGDEGREVLEQRKYTITSGTFISSILQCR